MPPKRLDTLDVRSRKAWRKWLAEHHESKSEIWLVFHKRHSKVASIEYDEAVEEALCFGWIDSILRRLDEARYARRFTPRKPGSVWSSANRRRYADLAARGRLAPAGRRRAPTDRSGDAPRPSLSSIPPYIEKALRSVPRAWEFFERLAPSYRRAYIGWIDAAKRETTREKRLREAIGLLKAGKKLGMK